VFASFLVQLFGWWLWWLLSFLGRSLGEGAWWVLFSMVFAFPLAGVGFALYRYFTWVGAGQGVATTAFVGGLLVKTFLIPPLQGIVTGAFIKWLIRVLGGGKPKSA